MWKMCMRGQMGDFFLVSCWVGFMGARRKGEMSVCGGGFGLESEWVHGDK